MSLNKKLLDEHREELVKQIHKEEQDSEQQKIEEPNPEEYVTMKRKEYDILKQSSDLAVNSMIESEDQRIVSLGESMLHSWNIFQSIVSSKKNRQIIKQNELKKQVD